MFYIIPWSLPARALAGPGVGAMEYKPSGLGWAGQEVLGTIFFRAASHANGPGFGQVLITND